MNCCTLGGTLILGEIPEWTKGADCKSAGTAYAGSNPARPIPPSTSRKAKFKQGEIQGEIQGLNHSPFNHSLSYCPCSSVVEHTLGKGEVTSSNLVTGLS